jgi:hypothetical protein
MQNVEASCIVDLVELSYSRMLEVGKVAGATPAGAKHYLERYQNTKLSHIHEQNNPDIISLVTRKHLLLRLLLSLSLR